MAHVLITGGAGFIGSHTADALIHNGHQVRILDRLDTQIHGQYARFPRYINPMVECMLGDVRNPADVNKALDGADVVYHFAALTGVGQSMYDIRNCVDTNCTGTAALLEDIVKNKRSINRFVLASSRAVYGEGSHICSSHGTVYPPIRQREDLEQGKFEVRCPSCAAVVRSVPSVEDRPLLPISVYAWTKKQQEELCQYAGRTFGLPVVILRYFNVYGSRQSLQNPYTGVVSMFYNRIMSDQPVFVYEHGTPGRDFVHVSDVARANLLALHADVTSGTCINVGSGNRMDILGVVNAVGEACERDPIVKDRGEFRVGDIHSCYADLTRARSDLGYAPRVDFENGMKEFVDWAVEEKLSDLYQSSVDELNRYDLFGRARSECGSLHRLHDPCC